jgi:cyclophilin family peptidyl-prolyl cis-trans isomerase
MHSPIKLLVCLVFAQIISSCNPVIEKGVRKQDLKKDVEMITDLGRIVIRLSDETPKNRNNFIYLVNNGFYNSIPFHRVIPNFIIQVGDPKTRTTASDNFLGDIALPYSIPKELSPTLFHKRGALNAARNGDDENPEQASSSTQFTVVQGRVFTDSTLNRSEAGINFYLAYNRVIHKPENKANFQTLQRLINTDGSADSIAMLQKKFKGLAKIDQAATPPYRIPEAQRTVYKTIGGAPHLDRTYTVFGEVVSGMEIVDKIAGVETNKNDRPVRDIKIISTRMIPRKQYDE